MSGKYQYKWKRFWVERGGETNLIDDGGFLYDPDAKYGDLFNPKTNSFESIQKIPCLVLLGEPGIGKSYSVKEAYENHSKEEGEEAFFLDLRSYGSEERLFRKIFESREFSSWCNGNHTLHLFLDSLDECLIQIKTVATLLVDELKQYPIKRLFFRIACRTAEWPDFLEKELYNLWGETAVKVYQMAPLRRVDVIEAAKARGIDSESFLKKIETKEAQPLAIKPVTLELLLNLFHEVNQFPKTLSELYFKGCRLLCNEVNPSRRTAGFTGSLNDDQRLVIAARIAALTIFANRYSISLETGKGKISEEDLSLKDLCGGYEEAFGERIKVNEEVIKEVLSTGLFISRGPRCLGWAHQTFAEYLAAHYINIHNMTIPQIMSILTHSGADNGSLIPQLYETSAWLAGMNREIFLEIMEIDPDILLRSDVSTVDDCVRKKMVDYLFLLFNEERLVRYDHYREEYYKKLSHPELAAQLRPYLEENSEISVSAKRAAIKMAHKCEVKELLNTLAEIPFRNSELIEIREAAAKAIAEIGDENSRKRLKPLALSDIEEDKEDQLKGYLLQAVWPGHIAARELFAVLTHKKTTLIGSYDIFIRNHITVGLDNDDLIPALDWVERQREHKTEIFRHSAFGELIEKIMHINRSRCKGFVIAQNILRVQNAKYIGV